MKNVIEAYNDDLFEENETEAFQPNILDTFMENSVKVGAFLGITTGIFLFGRIIVTMLF